MDKALACHTLFRVSKLDMTEDFFNYEKIISAPILLGTPAMYTLSLSLSLSLSSPMAWSNPGNR